MPSCGFNLIQCETAQAFWDVLSPERSLTNERGAFIYRGQSDARWGLVPSVFRKNSIVRSLVPAGMMDANMERFVETQLLKIFVENCDALGLQVPSDSFELREKLDITTKVCRRFVQTPSLWQSETIANLMALAQHHNVPTRLLDWSRRSYVAAYFAATDTLRNRSDKIDQELELAVWALKTEQISPMAPENGPFIKWVLHPNVRIVPSPGSTSLNLAAQAGVFTLLLETGAEKGPMDIRTLENEFAQHEETPLWKVTLKAIHAPDVLILCDKHWINAATMFPGYDGAGAAVSEKVKTWPSSPEMSPILWFQSMSRRTGAK